MCKTLFKSGSVPIAVVARRKLYEETGYVLKGERK